MLISSHKQTFETNLENLSRTSSVVCVWCLGHVLFPVFLLSIESIASLDKRLHGSYTG